MRIAAWLTVPLLGALIALPTQAPAQMNISVRFGTRLGPEIGVFGYSAERYGDWHANYRRWTPVTLYDVNGHYYRNAVSGSRAVQVYSYNNEYFLPPRDQAWANRGDRRFNYQRQPRTEDYGRARPYAPDAARRDPRLGDEIGVFAYSAERAGDWRTNYRRWTPVTAYEVNGHYYPNNVDGARPVSMYRYRNEYFLPPNDRAFAGHDRRFNYNHQPNDQDRGRVRDRP
jgi:hypothetical protein